MARQRIRQSKAGARSHARGSVVLNAVKLFKETLRLLRIDLQLLRSELAEKIGAYAYVECSSKGGIGYKEVFETCLSK